MTDISMENLGQNYRAALFLESLPCSLVKNGFSRQAFFDNHTDNCFCEVTIYEF